MIINHSWLIRMVLVGCVFLSLFTAGMLPATVHAAPAITSPPQGPPLSGATETFSWTTGGTPNIIEWWLYIGTSQGTNDIYDSGRIVGVGMTTDTVSGLPTDGSTLHVRLWWKVSVGGWSSTDQTYTAHNGSSAAGTRHSAVDNSAQTLNTTDQPFLNPATFISLPVTTTTAGTFVIGFSSRTSPQGCLVGPQGPCDTIQVIQAIFLDGQKIGSDARSSRVFEPGGGINKIVSWTVSASNIQPGAHTVEVKVACNIPGTATTCVSLGFRAASGINTLWAIHPN